MLLNHSITFILVNSFLKQSVVSSSIRQNSIISREVVLFARNFLASCTNILAHLSLGNPKIPELIAGIEILLNFISEASVKLLLTALLNFVSSSPSPILGPTVWITALHGNLPDVVITEEPTGTKPILSLSFCIISPPFLTMAPATPPPCFRYELASIYNNINNSFCNISSYKPYDIFFVS